ncbi:MAG: hypothetical protein ABSD03_16235 [Vulcanimicrobiaceae bacterium]|jgi:hypothetical protein
MTLLELNPRWVTAIEGRHGMGVSFRSTPARTVTGTASSRTGACGTSPATCRIVARPDAVGDAFYAALKPGDLVEGPPSFPTAWAFRCPVCGECWTMLVPQVHRVVQREPLTVTPSWLCPRGCHYFITDGSVRG